MPYKFKSSYPTNRTNYRFMKQNTEWGIMIPLYKQLLYLNGLQKLLSTRFHLRSYVEREHLSSEGHVFYNNTGFSS